MSNKKQDLAGKHVIVTGGSSGIGFALAAEAVKRKANVTIIARTESRLKAAQAQLQEEAQRRGTGSKIAYRVLDVTDAVKVRHVLAECVKDLGPVELLVCNAGAAHLGYFHETSLETFQQQMQLNFFGVLNVVHALYGDMVRRNSGHICLVGSALSTFGLVGYSAYCPSKYAVKGLADSLRNELQGTQVKISFAQPPDTDTPGFLEENKHKPPETKEISEAGATVFKPEQVAAGLMAGLLRGAYLLPTPDLGLQVNIVTTKGLTPRSFPGVLLDMLLSAIAPLVHWAFVAMFDRVARRHAQRRFAKLWASGEAEARSGGEAAAAATTPCGGRGEGE
ncbi:hypothetical protein PLESTB_000358700 [Pleodorina starrii]|uniref:3-dehydrosphinganine reductase n=1 Tax=Pleodorina starrii TaxID=330485 RepID=A0A9W6EYQ5_9CHLO|nr:hypothetical protein PLESTM_000036700 [Pleodorina starrii]GLC50248.1 hypothetical protein PLESTB_000358700 [Pleodorina starrii]GLC64370.1 hypothetical protein PLESTF_000154000 [Pleodorina starrii]